MDNTVFLNLADLFRSFIDLIKKLQKFLYRIFACKIICHHYYHKLLI